MPAAELIFRQLADATSSTYTYLLACPATREAVLVDPVFEQARRDAALLRELGLVLVATLDTHVHADHVTAAWLHRQRCGSRIGLAAAAGAEGVDLPLAHGDRVAFGRRHLNVRATPGHTKGCLSFVLDDESLAFTGDALLIRGCGRTDFQQGSARRLFHSVHEQLLSLPEGCLLYPAHDYKGCTVSSVAEERRWNPRFGGPAGQGPDEGDFVGTMAHLNLPHPKQIDRAVPANLRCGQPAGGDVQPPPEPTWAPLVWTFAGLWEIEPAALEERLHAVTVLDVREAAEWTGELGRIPGALHRPMAALGGAVATLPPGRPVVTVCRSGTRSAQAALLLARAGVAEVANLSGGLLRWRGEGYAVEGGEIG
jgi:glyoxylase-like metal-dependent hydrolase (beta-lactamase superfamily II)/rhodanese-related sulfurtransferase